MTASTTTKKAPAKRAAAKAPAAPAEGAYLDSLIPDESVGHEYVSRYIDGVQDMVVLSNAQQRGKHVITSGPTGAGKTMWVRAYCAQTRQPFVNVTGDGSMQAEDLFGKPGIDIETNGLRQINGPVLEVVMHGGVLNVDEVNFMRGKVTAALHGLFDGRRVLTLLSHPFKYFDPATNRYYVKAEDAPADARLAPVTGPAYIPAHPNLLVVASYNPDYADTAPINEAFLNRFARKIQWGYDTAVEAQLVASPNLLALATKLRDAKDGGQIRSDTPTNLLMEFEAMAVDDDLTFSFARSMFLSHYAADEQPTITTLFDLHKAELMEDYGWEAA